MITGLLIGLGCLPGLFIYLVGLSAVSRMNRPFKTKSYYAVWATVVSWLLLGIAGMWTAAVVTPYSTLTTHRAIAWGLVLACVWMVFCIGMIIGELVIGYNGDYAQTCHDWIRGLVWPLALSLQPVMWVIAKLALGLVFVLGVTGDFLANRRRIGRALLAPFTLGRHVADRLKPEVR